MKEGVAKSDEKVFKSLFNYFYPRLLNYAFVIIKNHETAEDIVLEVFHNIWESRQKLKGVERLEHYLYVCVKNKTLDHHRKNSRMVQVGFDEPHYKEHITHQNPEQKVLDEELLEIIDHAILDLPERARLIYRLVKEDGLKYHEAADVLGISEKTVNNQLLRAMKVIRKQVADYMGQDKKTPFFKVFKSLLFF